MKTAREQEAFVLLQRAADRLITGLGRLLKPYDLSPTQYNVLRILRGAGDEGLPTLSIRDRMIHEAPGITRLVDRLEEAGLVRRDRSTPDRRQVVCRITDAGLELLAALDAPMNGADDRAVAMLTLDEQRELVRLLDAVRAGHQRD